MVALEHNTNVAITRDLEAAFEAAYLRMLNGESLVCSRTRKEIPAHPARVSVAIIDVGDIVRGYLIDDNCLLWQLRCSFLIHSRPFASGLWTQ